MKPYGNLPNSTLWTCFLFEKNIQETELSGQIMKLQTTAWLGTLSELADQI